MTLDSDKQSVLIVDDDPDILTAARLLLKRHFDKVVLCAQPTEIPSIMDKHRFDVILLDMNYGVGESDGNQGFNWLSQILDINPDAVIIMITAHGDMNLAVEAMKRGATDFIAKPWLNPKMLATVNAAKELSASRHNLKKVTLSHQSIVSAIHTETAILGNSAELSQVLHVLQKAAPTSANVLILGENGTGKELLARELHKQSSRANKVFMSVDLGALSESLFESELFGHKKGAFTGALSDRVGKIVAANGGTLFLDEIGNIPLHLQAKLLTVLAQRHVTPVGDNQAENFDVRIVAATNLPYERLYDEHHFRQDLLFRLNTVELKLPALRNRRDDILPIAQHYTQQYARKYHKTIKDIDEQAQQTLREYDWPGNIRALRHAIERAVIMTNSNTLSIDDFQLTDLLVHDRAKSSGVAPHLPSNSAVNQKDSTPPNSNTSPHVHNEFNLDEIEKNTISHALRSHKYNISHTAKALGLTRAALYRRMEKHGL